MLSMKAAYLSYQWEIISKWVISSLFLQGLITGLALFSILSADIEVNIKALVIKIVENTKVG